MQETALHAVTVFMGFFAMMNPVANAPIFLGLTADDDEPTTRAIAFRSLSLAFLIVFIFSVAGKLIFELFGISMPAFRIAGGLIVSLIGLHMLQGHRSSLHHQQRTGTAEDRDAALSVAVSPLATPILAGPGTIATAMNFSAAGGLTGIVMTICAFALLCAITYVFFVFGQRLVALIGTTAVSAITRLMGFILAVIGVQMFIEGARGALGHG